MTKAKIAVTMEDTLVAAARQAVAEGRAASVSAYVEEAVANKAAAETLDELLTGLLAETGGPMTDAERAAADEIIG